MSFKLDFEPYKIKVVEWINITTREERLRLIDEAHYNVFYLKSKDIIIDLLTDSGTGALSDVQVGRMAMGDESYAGARSWDRFYESARRYTTKKHIIPVHQGRGAEKLIAEALLKEGDVVVSNTLFDTTMGNFQYRGARLINLPDPSDYDFKGNIDLERLEEVLKEEGERVKLIVMTITNNSGGGQPVSLKNLKAVRELADKYGVLLMIDACRASENSFFVKHRDPDYRDRSILEIVNETLALADLITFSAKKDGLNNIGGFIATDDEELALRLKTLGVLFEGFPTYGGMAGRDMEAIAVGLMESVREDYLAHRTGQVKFLNDLLDEMGIPVLQPAGGHAVYVLVDELLPHIPAEEFPGQSLVVALYVFGGVRGVEIGKLMFPDAQHNMVRLAIPRRTYTESHLRYVAGAFGEIKEKADCIRGMRITYEPEYLRHFLAHLEPLDDWVKRCSR